MIVGGQPVFNIQQIKYFFYKKLSTTTLKATKNSSYIIEK